MQAILARLRVFVSVGAQIFEDKLTDSHWRHVGEFDARPGIVDRL